MLTLAVPCSEAIPSKKGKLVAGRSVEEQHEVGNQSEPLSNETQPTPILHSTLLVLRPAMTWNSERIVTIAKICMAHGFFMSRWIPNCFRILPRRSPFVHRWTPHLIRIDMFTRAQSDLELILSC